ncbi:MAG: hypothetical protein DRP75_03695 [Candidatus Omnitrophota bacterium]|nr:MAG: hypothetical protein DRP75_03695 [Candidatus Omnitrophota bacterium]
MRISFIPLDNLKDVREELRKIGVDREGLEIMAEKGVFRVLKIEGIKREAGIILKQEALSLGAEAALHREVITGKVQVSDCLLMGTLAQLKVLAQKIERQPFGLREIGKMISRRLEEEQS